jgi:hypothetical protein
MGLRVYGYTLWSLPALTVLIISISGAQKYFIRPSRSIVIEHRDIAQGSHSAQIYSAQFRVGVTFPPQGSQIPLGTPQKQARFFVCGWF